MKKINLPHILFVSISLSLAVVYGLSWLKLIVDPVQRTGSDFMAFYAAGHGILQNNMAAAYDLNQIAAQQEDVLGFRIPDQSANLFLHPPFILPILWVVAHFDYVPAYYLWAGFMLILCIVCAQLAMKIFSLATFTNRIALWTGIMLFFPLFVSVINGQDSALLLLGAMFWYYGLTHNSNRVAGLGLALTTIRPQVALMLGVPFLFHEPRRKVWWWFCLGGGILVLISIALIGQDGVQNYLNTLSVTATGDGYRTNEIAMVNLIGLLKHLLPSINAAAIRLIGWGSNLAGVVILCGMWRKASEIEGRLISLAIIIALFTSPHTHYYDLALLIIPTLIVVRELVAAEKVPLKYALLIPLGISLLFAFTYSVKWKTATFTFLTIYLVEISLLVIPWLLTNREHEERAHLLSE